MARLIDLALCSLDGYVADREGRFDWAEPDREVHAFVNDVLRGVHTYLFGRRNYQMMTVWETMDLENEPAYMRDYAEIWRATDKVVYSRTLGEVSTARTRLEPEFDPDTVGRMKGEAAHDLAIAGPELAGHAFRAGLIDEVHLFLAPIVIGGGNSVFPEDFRVDLELVEDRRFANGTLYMRYGVR